MEFDWTTLIGGLVAAVIGLLILLILGASIVAGYTKNVNDYEDRKKTNSL